MSTKYYGPYVMKEKIGKVIRKLRLPTTSKIHPVFHVSLLKKKIRDKVTPVLQLLDVDEKGT